MLMIKIMSFFFLKKYIFALYYLTKRFLLLFKPCSLLLWQIFTFRIFKSITIYFFSISCNWNNRNFFNGMWLFSNFCFCFMHFFSIFWKYFITRFFSKLSFLRMLNIKFTGLNYSIWFILWNCKSCLWSFTLL